MASQGQARRVALLGQKESMLRAIFELGHVGRKYSLEVLVLVPSNDLLTPAIRSACTSFGFCREVAAVDDNVRSKLKHFKPDLVFSILWPRRILEDALALCKDCINIHPSLLPRHRGSMTQFWAIFEGDAEAGVTCHRMVHDFDAGRILHQVPVPIVPDETALSLNGKLALASECCFQHVLQLFLEPAGIPDGRVWDVNEFPYRFRRIPNKGIIDRSWPEEKVERFIRACYFPPHSPALMVAADGTRCPVTTMDQYKDVRCTFEERRLVPHILPRHAVNFDQMCAWLARKELSGFELGKRWASLQPAFQGRVTNPEDGKVYSFDELKARHEGTRSLEDLEHFFLNTCTPTEADLAGAERTKGAPARMVLKLLVFFVVPVAAALLWMLQARGTADPTAQRLPGHDAVRHSLSNHPRARCLDGSSPNFYFAPSKYPRHGRSGRKPASSKWILYLQGGGWCAGDPAIVNLPGYSAEDHVAHPDLCTERAKGYHGSAQSDAASRSFNGMGFLSGVAEENPMMFDWNRVLIRNCDGTLFLSSLEMPLQSGDTSLFFRGRDNVFAVLRELLTNHGLAKATEIVVSGCSAGAVASVLLVDEVQRYLQKRTRTPVFVTALADSGVFADWRSVAGPGAMQKMTPSILSFPQMKWIFENTNSSGSAPSGCLEAALGWRCLLVDKALKYVKTPVFLLQSAIDSWQISDINQQDAIREFSSLMHGEIQKALRTPAVQHGAVVDSCLHHCREWGKLYWGPWSNIEVFQHWYTLRQNAWGRLGVQNATWPLVQGGVPLDGAICGSQDHQIKALKAVKRTAA